MITHLFSGIYTFKMLRSGRVDLGHTGWGMFVSFGAIASGRLSRRDVPRSCTGSCCCDACVKLSKLL
jgi:hypothetical protein